MYIYVPWRVHVCGIKHYDHDLEEIVLFTGEDPKNGRACVCVSGFVLGKLCAFVCVCE